jgi:hypothetical protein
VPGTPDQPGGADGSGGPDQSNGQPRPFFADQPDQSPERGDSGQPGEPGQPGLLGSPYGQPTGQGPLYGGPPQQEAQDGPGQPDDQQAGWPPSNQVQQRPTVQRPTAQRRTPQRTGRPPERELRQRAIASLAFGVIALVALFGLGTDLHRGVYVLIFSAVVGIAGVVIGVSSLVKARKTGSYRPRFAVGGIVFGALATLISVPILATYLAFPTQVDNYVNCLHQAQNSSDQRACMTKFYKSIHIGALPPHSGNASITGGTTGLSGVSGSAARPPTDR